MIENRSIDAAYELACFNCGVKTDLMQVAHRNYDQFIVGYLFLCGACLEKIGGKYYVSLLGFQNPDAKAGQGDSEQLGNTR